MKFKVLHIISQLNMLHGVTHYDCSAIFVSRGRCGRLGSPVESPELNPLLYAQSLCPFGVIRSLGRPGKAGHKRGSLSSECVSQNVGHVRDFRAHLRWGEGEIGSVRKFGHSGIFVANVAFFVAILRQRCGLGDQTEQGKPV